MDTKDFLSHLIFSEVKAEHRGKYTCKAENKAGYATFSEELVVNGMFLISFFDFVPMLFIVFNHVFISSVHILFYARIERLLIFCRYFWHIFPALGSATITTDCISKNSLFYTEHAIYFRDLVEVSLFKFTVRKSIPNLTLV